MCATLVRDSLRETSVPKAKRGKLPSQATAALRELIDEAAPSDEEGTDEELGKHANGEDNLSALYQDMRRDVKGKREREADVDIPRKDLNAIARKKEADAKRKETGREQESDDDDEYYKMIKAQKRAEQSRKDKKISYFILHSSTFFTLFLHLFICSV